MWMKIKDRKWELKHNNVVLATIFHRPTDGLWSLYISSPIIYEYHHITGKTHRFQSMKEAQQAFLELGTKMALPWCRSMVDYFSSEQKEHYCFQENSEV
jgi:hypothetical protein